MNRVVHPMLAAVAICAAALAAFARSPEPPLAHDEISALELAEWIHAREPGLAILDLRSAQARRRDALPGARAVPEFDGQGVDTVVVYSEREVGAIPAVRGSPSRVLKLRGGITAWNEEVMFPSIRSDASERQKQDFAARARLSRYFGGSPRVRDPGDRAARTRSRRGC